MKKNVMKLAMLLLPCLSIAQERVFVVNEGNFGSANGSLSVYDSGSLVLENDVFIAANSLPLGDVVQSMTIINDKAYIVVNGSAKIEVVDAETMTSITTITEVSSPRYIAQVSDQKAYITDWSGEVLVLDLPSHTVTATIPVGLGPENLAVSGAYAFVANKGGFGLDSTLSVIDIASDEVLETIVVGEKPAYVQVDINGAVWVLSEGNTLYDENWNVLSETAGQLTKINSSTLGIENSFTFEIGEHPMNLVINDSKEVLYYKNGGWSTSIFTHNINASELASEAIISKSFYALGAHNGMIYGADAMDFAQAGWVFQYTESAVLVDSFQVGIIPGGFCFESSESTSIIKNNTEASRLGVYPNPASVSDGFIHLESKELIRSIEVYNSIGVCVNKLDCGFNTYQLDIRSFAKGIYTVVANGKEGRFSGKIILQ